MHLQQVADISQRADTLSCACRGQVAGAWGQLLSGADALAGESTYLFDLADVGRQVWGQGPSSSAVTVAAARANDAG